MIGNLGLMLARNELIGLVGPNETGKAASLRTISRLCSLRGTFRFDGVDRDSLIPECLFSREFVQVSEGQQRFDKMTDEEALLVDALHQRDRIEMLRALERVYALLLIPTNPCRQFAENLSGGEPQVCAMTRQRMPGPRLLTVNEVSHVLAPAVAHQLLRVLSQIRKQGIAVLLLEQDTFAALSVAGATDGCGTAVPRKKRLARCGE